MNLSYAANKNCREITYHHFAAVLAKSKRILPTQLNEPISAFSLFPGRLTLPKQF